MGSQKIPYFLFEGVPYLVSGFWSPIQWSDPTFGFDGAQFGVPSLKSSVLTFCKIKGCFVFQLHKVCQLISYSWFLPRWHVQHLTSPNFKTTFTLMNNRGMMHTSYLSRTPRTLSVENFFCHVEKLQMWRQFLCGEISDI